MAKFSENFWNTDICNTTGFDTLVKRMKDGKRMCMDCEEYLEKRAKIERDYGESLLRLSRSVSGRDEIGTLRSSWDQMKAETETVGRLHTSLAQQITEQVHHTLKEFREQQRVARKKSEDTVKRAAQHKKSCFDKNNQKRSTYESKCRDADKAEEASNRLHSNPQAKSDKLQSAAKRLDVARQAADNADMNYQDSVRNLEDGRQLWEREMELLCRTFQELEEQRIAYLRHQMWTYTNLWSKNTVDIDAACESIRKSLEDCDVDADIDLFVREKAIGANRPQTIPYINYYNPTSGGNTLGGVGVRTGGAVSFVGSSLPPPPQKALPLTPIESAIASSAVGGNQPEPPDTYSTIGETMDQNVANEDYYAAPRATDKSPMQVVALYNYEAQGDQELNLEEGDVVIIMEREDDVWWCGKSDDGRMGMFPAAYVEPYGDDS